ncbi:site-2 protease family protein [Paenibacillus sp. J2TS4]|uniref:site-2 protease family protein n=1 Tax=Paenibacillus sp. J2TS4 TaxID=2807194 RepID=UPI001AFDB17D|nr:site-2 protease family protein [Paenibacillus sp. J2TS4]GIP32337.1 site-2 protease family protein [Paenibacillus sp. J2TS4]
MELLAYFDLDTLLFRAVAFMLAITLHDVWLSVFALLLGDRTAREQGRVHGNPGRHLDPLGSLMVLFGPYGWSRPVTLSPKPLEKSSRFMLILWALSGPLLHLVLSLLFGWLFLELPLDGPLGAGGGWAGALLKGILHYCYIVNVLLFLLNLLPLYPLDGWKLLRHLASGRMAAFLDKYEKWSLLVLMALLMLPFGRHWLEMLFQQVNHWLMAVYSVG